MHFNPDEARPTCAFHIKLRYQTLDTEMDMQLERQTADFGKYPGDRLRSLAIYLNIFLRSISLPHRSETALGREAD